MYKPKVQNSQTDLLMRAILQLDNTEDAYRFFDNLGANGQNFAVFTDGLLLEPPAYSAKRNGHLHFQTGDDGVPAGYGRP